MSAEVLQRAFDPFFTTKPLGQGTGLGLSQVFGFVKQSEGHIKLYSQAGHGTTVKIYLPKLDGSVEDRAEGAVDTRQVGRARRETILVVEDNDAVRLFTTDTLRDLGFDVIEAVDAAEALRFSTRTSASISCSRISGCPVSTAASWRRPCSVDIRKFARCSPAAMRRCRRPRARPRQSDIPLLSKPFTRAQLYERVCEVLDA